LSSSDIDNAFGVVLFHSVHGCIGAERLLMDANVSHKLIPVPRQFSSDCGFCLRFRWSDRDTIARLLGNDLGIEGVHPL
jgi:hypothetical protein